MNKINLKTTCLLFIVWMLGWQSLGIGSVPNANGWNPAQWIGFAGDQRPAEFAGRMVQTGKHKQPEPVQQRSFPSPLLRKSFAVEKSVRSAQIQVCGLGLYELYLNGKKIGDRVLDPAQTTYDQRAFYVTHAVTGLLLKGDNAIGLMLGNGFYGQNIAFGSRMIYGAPRAILRLNIEYEDGSRQTILSDSSWKAAQGPVLFDNIYAGETYDARRELAGWSKPGFDDSAWKPVQKMAAPTTSLIEQQLEPMRKIRSLRPIAVMATTNGDWILDLGQNLTGWLQMRLREATGRQIRMRFAEVLMPDGKAIDTASTGVFATGVEQTDIYVCKGGGVEEWEPRFTYHGFRYVQISGLSQKPDLNDFTGWLVHTDVQRIGTFECSDAMINKFYKISIWTIEDNLQGILTDCPHRERCGWMGDAEAVCETASYNFDLTRFWPKVSEDMATVLGANPPRKNVGLPADPRAPCNVTVGRRLCGQARPDWGAATVLVPWFDWLYYGDLKPVKTAWPMMQGWLAFLDQFAVKNGIIAEGYGDWCPPGSTEPIDTPVPLTSTALYYQSLEAMRQMALALGKTAEANIYAAKAATIKKAFFQRFYRPAKHDFGSQTGTAMALHLGLIPDGEEAHVADGLVALIMQKANGHYSTGIFGHRPLYTVLNDFGYADVTRHLWSITDYPSLGFLTEKYGMTTWPERYFNWHAGERYPDRSLNHPMQSGFAAVFHESLGGIRPDPTGPGFNHFILKPCFLPSLEWVKVEHRSPYGLISSHWKREGKAVIWEISVPPGSTALVQLLQFPAEKLTLNGQPVEKNNFEIAASKWKIVAYEK